MLVNHNTSLSVYFQSDPSALSSFAGKLCEAGIITTGMRNNPVYINIESQFTATMNFHKTQEDFEKDCQAFLAALTSQGGPLARASISISEEWRDNAMTQLNISLNV